MKTSHEAQQKVAGAAVNLCVIGGGASGAGCALDAQLRGLRTVLVDAGDFAGATSSAATKIIHGGVRYLQDAVRHLDVHQYRVVRKALRERILMLHNAPFLTRTLEFVVPCFSWFEVLYYGIGLEIYDWIAGRARLFPSRYISRTDAIKKFPSLKSDRLTGAIVYADGDFDDSRYDLTLIRSFTDGHRTRRESNRGKCVPDYSLVSKRKCGGDTRDELASHHRARYDKGGFHGCSRDSLSGFPN